MWNVSAMAILSIFRGQQVYDEDEIESLSVVWLAQHGFDGSGWKVGQEAD